MLTATRQTKAGQIERNIHVERTDALRVTITETKLLKTKTTSSSMAYRLERIDSHIGGVGVEVVKLEGSGEVYHVLLGRHETTCTCPGGVYGKTPCRHALACQEAQRRNLL
jgi:hypothetical protein